MTSQLTRRFERERERERGFIDSDIMYTEITCETQLCTHKNSLLTESLHCWLHLGIIDSSLHHHLVNVACI